MRGPHEGRSGRAPIALFAYRRPRHLRKTLKALKSCPGFDDSPVFVYADGPKTAAAEADVQEVRRILRGFVHPQLNVVESQENRGLAASIIGGVTELTERFGRVIVIEDDIVLRPPALEWFNAALSAFESRDEVFHITAYQFRAPEFRTRSQGMMAPFASSWGWATWQRAWQHFDPKVTGHEAVLNDPARRRAYNLDDSFPMAEHLEAYLRGHHDSWASRWYWTLFKARATAVFPPSSLVENIGFDETATHNNIGWLKRFLATPAPYEWDGPGPPELPKGSNPQDVAAFQRALRRTGAMRNVRIKAALSKAGLWKKGG